MTKRIIAVIVFLLLVVPTVLAAEPLFTIEPVELKRFDEAEIELKVGAVPGGGLNTIEGKITFDKDTIRVVGYKANDACTIFAANIKNDIGEVVFGGGLLQGGIEETTVVTFTIKHIGTDQDETTSVQLSLTEAIDASAVNIYTEYPVTFDPVEIRVVDELTVPLSVVLLSPIGGERWGGFKKIQWDATGDPLTVDLSYSDDGGSTWIQIEEGLENTGEYTWNTGVVEQGGDQFVVKVQVTDGENTEYDESGLFTIALLGESKTLAGPIPARTRVTFYYDFEEDGYLYIYSEVGRLVYKTRVYAVNGYYEWDLTNSNGVMLANGTYFYRLITDGGEMSEAGALKIERGLGLGN